MRAFLLLIAIIFVLNAPAQAQYRSFWEQEAIGFLQDYDLVRAPGTERAFFQAVHKHTQDILERFPPSEWYYVSVGRSGAAIAADLNVLSESRPEIEIKTIAWSGLRETKNQLPSAVAEFADSYLKNHLPQTSKKILFIDYAQTGDSIVSFDSFLKTIYQRGRYGYYLLLSPENGFALRYYLYRHMPRPTKFAALAGRDLLYKALKIQGLDHFAEYGRFTVKSFFMDYAGNASAITLPRQRVHEELVDWIRNSHRQFLSTVPVRTCRAIFVM